MALITEIPEIGPQERMRYPYTFKDAESVTSSSATDHFRTGNITGAVVYVKATSAAGTPNYTLSLQTAPDETNFVTVDAMSKPDFGAINDENGHTYIVNFSSCHMYSRFYITLNAGDGGDDKFTIKVCFLYGNFTHAQDVSLEAGSVTLGDVRLRDGVTATNYADINAANTARTTGTKVVAVQPIDAEGHVVDWSDLDDCKTALQVIDDWDETDRCKVNPIAGQAGVAAGAGTSNALTQRIVTATDSPDVTALEKIDDWEDSGAFADYAKVTIYGDNGAGAPIKMLMDAAGNPQVDVVTMPHLASAVDFVSAVQSGAWSVSAVQSGAWNVTEANSSAISAAVATPTTLTGGSKTVAAAGTAEALGSSLATKSIYIRAKAGNTSFVCVGDSTVDESTNQQIVLYANDAVTLEIANRATVYVDADVNGEGVDYLCAS